MAPCVANAVFPEESLPIPGALLGVDALAAGCWQLLAAAGECDRLAKRPTDRALVDVQSRSVR